MASKIAKSPGSKPSKEVTLVVPSTSRGSKVQLNSGSRSPPDDSEATRIAEEGWHPTAEARRRMLTEARHRMIAEAAYYIAEHRGFGAGRELEDWLLAEKEIDMNLCEAAAQAPRWCDL